MDVMGVAFRRDLFLVTRQVYPELQDKDKLTHTKIQQKLLRKMGDNAFPFFFEVRRTRTADHHGPTTCRSQTQTEPSTEPQTKLQTESQTETWTQTQTEPGKEHSTELWTKLQTELQKECWTDPGTELWTALTNTR